MEQTARKPPIALAVDDVVEQIHDARARAEDRKGRGRPGHRFQVEESASENESSEDQEIFRPLTGPQRGEQI